MSTYLLVNVLSVSLPFLLSFDKKVHFVSYWKFLFPSIIITGAVFIPWDIIFTSMGIWGFNPMHLSGVNVINLPIEEWMFFITIPYAAIFSYEVYIAYFKTDYFARFSRVISTVLIIILILLAVIYNDRLYTLITFTFTAIYILVLQFIFKVHYLGRFYFTYMIVLIPFLLVNGILTGSFIPEEVVWYNNAENMGIRLFTIPVEDSVYGLLLILMNISIYERLRK